MDDEDIVVGGMTNVGLLEPRCSSCECATHLCDIVVLRHAGICVPDGSGRAGRAA